MAVSDGENMVVIVAADLLGLFFADTREIARGVSRVPADSILVTCTHVHSAPDVIGLWGPNQATSGVDPVYLEMVKRRAARVINAAAANMQPARLRFARCEAPEKTGYNTRERDLIDPEMSIVQAVTPDGQPIATLVNYACHPEVLTTPSRLVTSDYVHYLREEMEAAGTGDVLFCNGALGGMITNIVEILSGGNILLLLIITAVASLLLGMGLPTTATYIVMALATASAQEVIRPFPKPLGFWQLMPISCFTIALAGMPLLQASETRRPIASFWLAAQPPAFPIVVNSSKQPSISRFTVT